MSESSTPTAADQKLVDGIIQWEEGRPEKMTAEEEVEFFQYLVDTGHAWTLQGAYGRRAISLIQEGRLTQTGDALAAAAKQGVDWPDLLNTGGI